MPHTEKVKMDRFDVKWKQVPEDVFHDSICGMSAYATEPSTDTLMWKTHDKEPLALIVYKDHERTHYLREDRTYEH